METLNELDLKQSAVGNKLYFMWYNGLYMISARQMQTNLKKRTNETK